MKFVNTLISTLKGKTGSALKWALRKMGELKSVGQMTDKELLKSVYKLGKELVVRHRNMLIAIGGGGVTLVTFRKQIAQKASEWGINPADIFDEEEEDVDTGTEEDPRQRAKRAKKAAANA